MKLEVGKQYRLLPFTPEIRAKYEEVFGPGMPLRKINIASAGKVYTVSRSYNVGFNSEPRIKLAEDERKWIWLECSFAPIPDTVQLEIR